MTAFSYLELVTKYPQAAGAAPLVERLLLAPAPITEVLARRRTGLALSEVLKSGEVPAPAVTAR